MQVELVQIAQLKITQLQQEGLKTGVLNSNSANNKS